MKLKLAQVGNSKGIRLNKFLIEQCNLSGEAEVEATVTENGLLISPIRNMARADWEERFKAAIAKGQHSEGDMLGEINNDFDQDDWSWPEIGTDQI